MPDELVKSFGSGWMSFKRGARSLNWTLCIRDLVSCWLVSNGRGSRHGILTFGNQFDFHQFCFCGRLLLERILGLGIPRPPRWFRGIPSLGWGWVGGHTFPGKRHRTHIEIGIVRKEFPIARPRFPNILSIPIRWASLKCRTLAPWRSLEYRRVTTVYGKLYLLFYSCLWWWSILFLDWF